MEFNLSDKIKSKIVNDNIFSLRLAIVLDKRQDYILKLAKRPSSEKLLILYPAVEFYKQEGYSEKEIFSKTYDNEKTEQKN